MTGEVNPVSRLTGTGAPLTTMSARSPDGIPCSSAPSATLGFSGDQSCQASSPAVEVWRPCSLYMIGTPLDFSAEADEDYRPNGSVFIDRTVRSWVDLLNCERHVND